MKKITIKHNFNMYSAWTTVEGDGFFYSGPLSHINSIVGVITSDDIDELFHGAVSNAKDADEEITSHPLIDPFEEVTQEFKIISDYDAYWLGKGECPKCKDSTKPECIPGGGFKCPNCENTMEQLK